MHLFSIHIYTKIFAEHLEHYVHQSGIVMLIRNVTYFILFITIHKKSDSRHLRHRSGNVYILHTEELFVQQWQIGATIPTAAR